jgi:hypothetical protein
MSSKIRVQIRSRRRLDSEHPRTGGAWLVAIALLHYRACVDGLGDYSETRIKLKFDPVGNVRNKDREVAEPEAFDALSGS